MSSRRLAASAAALVLASLTLGACAYAPQPTLTSALPVFPQKTQTELSLNALPAPQRPVAVAVYGFTDQTGQFKTVDTGQTLSRAITQGGGSILVKALQDAGDRRWFTVVEREQLKDLLSERQIISEMRQRYLGEQNVNPRALPALLFAGVLLEGGVVSYDTNTLTGGAGAALLGLGVNGTYKQDTVTVYLRAVSVKTGEVLTTITASKTITSRALQANVFAYVASDKILQNEMGLTTNEPGQLALRQAIEKAVYGLVMEGADQKLWSFADRDAGWPLIWRYKQERDGFISAAQAQRLAPMLRHAKAGRAEPPPPPPVDPDAARARLQAPAPPQAPVRLQLAAPGPALAHLDRPPAAAAPAAEASDPIAELIRRSPSSDIAAAPPALSPPSPAPLRTTPGDPAQAPPAPPARGA